VANAFRGSRTLALRKLRGFNKQGDFATKLEVRQSLVSEWETGESEPTLTQVNAIADLLECTTDFLLGRTWNDVDIRVAASAMSFDVFAGQLNVSDEWRARCRRVLGHEAAPVTSTGWRHLAEQIDRAVGPNGAGQTHIKAVK
jgi:transcriptional regulator with XRE-family HTH domain